MFFHFCRFLRFCICWSSFLFNVCLDVADKLAFCQEDTCEVFTTTKRLLYVCAFCKKKFPFLQLRYKETFELSKGRYHTVKDALDITYHRRVTDDISEVRASK